MRSEKAAKPAGVQPYLTERSSLPVTARGFLGCTARAQSSPSQWPCMISMGLSLSLTSTSKISLSWVPASSLSAFQHTLRMDSPGGTGEGAQCWPCPALAMPELIPSALGHTGNARTHSQHTGNSRANSQHTANARAHSQHTGASQLIQSSRSSVTSPLSSTLRKLTPGETGLLAHLGNLKTSSTSQDLKI